MSEQLLVLIHVPEADPEALSAILMATQALDYEMRAFAAVGPASVTRVMDAFHREQDEDDHTVHLHGPINGSRRKEH